MIVGDLLLCFIYATCKTAFVLTITLSKMLINIGVYWHNLILPTQPYNSFSIKDDVGVTNDDDINNKNSNPQIFILKTGERNVKSK